MRPSLLLLVLLFASCLRLFAVELTEGITRAELESLVGKPISVMQRGDKVVLAYPRKGRAEFVGGKLVYFERIEVLDTPAPAKVPALPAATAKVSAPPPAPVPASTQAIQPSASTQRVQKSPVVSSAKQPAVAPPAPARPASPAPAVPSDETSEEQAGTQLSPEEKARLAKQEAEMARLQERLLNGESLAPAAEEASEPTSPWLLMLIQALFKIPVTVVVLKLAFKWSDVDADWSQMWLPAAADTLVRFSVQAIAEAAWGLDTLFYVDESLAFFALLFTLLKTTHACTLPRAIGVAFAAKLASIVVWAILSVFILGLLFSNAHS